MWTDVSAKAHGEVGLLRDGGKASRSPDLQATTAPIVFSLSSMRRMTSRRIGGLACVQQVNDFLKAPRLHKKRGVTYPVRADRLLCRA